MAEIQAPNGYEVNEAIDGANDIMEVFQPGSAGTRRNKKALLNTLATFFRTIIGGVLDNIVTFDAAGLIQDSGINISDVNDNTTHRGSDGKNHSDVLLNNTHRSSDGSDHDFIDQDVQTTASPTFDGINTGGTVLKQKVISAAIVGSTAISIAHGLTAGNIRGLSLSVNTVAGYIIQFRVNGANVEALTNNAITATVYCVVSYV